MQVLLPITLCLMSGMLGAGGAMAADPGASALAHCVAQATSSPSHASTAATCVQHGFATFYCIIEQKPANEGAPANPAEAAIGSIALTLTHAQDRQIFYPQFNVDNGWSYAKIRYLWCIF